MFSPLVEIFNEKIQQLLAGGFISHWYQDMLDAKGITRNPEKIKPQVLTMEHVTIGFFVCLCPLILSVAVFFCEVLFFWLRSKYY